MSRRARACAFTANSSSTNLCCYFVLQCISPSVPFVSGCAQLPPGSMCCPPSSPPPLCSWPGLSLPPDRGAGSFVAPQIACAYMFGHKSKEQAIKFNSELLFTVEYPGSQSGTTQFPSGMLQYVEPQQQWPFFAKKSPCTQAPPALAFSNNLQAGRRGSLCCCPPFSCSPWKQRYTGQCRLSCAAVSRRSVLGVGQGDSLYQNSCSVRLILNQAGDQRTLTYKEHTHLSNPSHYGCT